VRVGRHVAIGVPDQHKIAVAFELVARIGHDAILGRLDRRALRHREIDAVVLLAVGFGTEAGNNAALYRPAEGRCSICLDRCWGGGLVAWRDHSSLLRLLGLLRRSLGRQRLGSCRLRRCSGLADAAALPAAAAFADGAASGCGAFGAFLATLCGAGPPGMTMRSPIFSVTVGSILLALARSPTERP
jgi:hypothetical protein